MVEEDQHRPGASAGAPQVRVRRVITSRAGGYSTGRYHGLNLSMDVGDNPVTVSRNRERLAEKLQLPLEKFVFMEQLNSPHVTFLDELPAGQGIGPHLLSATDAVVTTLVDVPLVTLVADAVPVLLADEEAGIIAAINASRWGTRAGIVSRTLSMMEDHGAHPHRMHALLGPSASGSNCYVDAATATDMEKHLPNSTAHMRDGTWRLDLRRGIAHQLVAAGLSGVTVDPRCTIADGAFFSEIRDGVTGRQSGLIWRSTR